MAGIDEKRTSGQEPCPEEGPSWPGQSASGVDLTLLVENLKLTPTERLERNRLALQAAEEVRRAARAVGLLEGP